MAHLADAGLKHRSIKTYSAGVRYFHIKMGLGDPFHGDMPQVEYIMRGIKKREAAKGTTSRERLPVTPAILHQLKSVWAPSGHTRDTKLILAACCLGFLGFLRAGEMTVPSEGAYDPDAHLNVVDHWTMRLSHPSSE